MAKHTSLKFTSSIGDYLQEPPLYKATTDFDKLEEAIAHIEDSVSLQAKYSKQLNQKIAFIAEYYNPNSPVITGVHYKAKDS